jgi:hypothetical protein
LPQPEPLRALPDFGPVRADRDAALAEMRRELEDAVAGAAARIALRRELRGRRAEASDAASRDFLRGRAAEDLDEAETRRLRAAKARAGKAARQAFLAERGLGEVPRRRVVLFSGAQGSGKTATVAKALAGLRGGGVTVLVPTLAKAEELAAAIERHRPAHMAVKVWRGRLAPPRAPTPGRERMCGRPRKLIDRAQRAGADMGKTFCSACRLRADCFYLAQIDHLEALEGARIVVAAHEMAFLPVPFASDLVIVDEDLATKAARAVEIDPARLLDPEKWADAPALGATARTVAAALERTGGELAALREAA